MNTKHTPGDWHIVQGGALSISTDDEEANREGFIALICEKLSDERMQANAQLIAAAPELLKALQLLPLSEFNRDGHKAGAADFVDNSGDFIMAMDAARDAIAKATGEAVS